jgi:hypothetical protein
MCGACSLHFRSDLKDEETGVTEQPARGAAMPTNAKPTHRHKKSSINLLYVHVTVPVLSGCPRTKEIIGLF